MKLRALSLSTLSIFAAGCAGRTEVASLANQSSAVLNQYRKEMTSFAQNQTRLSQDNERRLADLAAMRAAAEGGVQRRLLEYRLAGEKIPIELFETVSTRKAGDLLAITDSLQRGPSAGDQVVPVKFDAGQIEAVIKRLKNLQHAPTLWDQVAFAVAYNKSLHEAYKNSLQKASEEASQSVQQ